MNIWRVPCQIHYCRLPSCLGLILGLCTTATAVDKSSEVDFDALSAPKVAAWQIVQANTAKTIERHRPFVIYEGDLAREDNATGFGSAWRMPGLYEKGEGWIVERGPDIDGDGSSNDDFVSYRPFSMEVPLSPHYLNPELPTRRFYGGLTHYYANTDPEKKKSGAEGYINPDHYPPYYDSRAEDFAFNGQADGRNRHSAFRHYGLWLFKKEDFLNGADQGRVRFNAQSMLKLYVARYYHGWNDERMVVRNGDQFYISEATFDVPDWMNGMHGMGCGKVFRLRPSESRWVEYHPQGYQIDFDAEAADFRDVTFDDVTAVGWYVAKTTLDNHETHLKWYTYQAEGLVTTPADPSRHCAMQEVPEGDGVPSFWMGTCEVPFEMWRPLYWAANSPIFGDEPRYTFLEDGDMGSTDFGVHGHGQGEPVTDVPWYDALMFCNYLSELEGLDPCYYTDDACSVLFRGQELATCYEGGGAAESATMRPILWPDIHVKWSADGYRLPTASEWLQAWSSGGNRASPTATSSSTAIVGSSPADGNGIHDLAGNVREWIWTASDIWKAGESAAYGAAGSSFRGQGDPRQESGSAYGDHPVTGRFDIGLRLIRRRAGLPAPKPSDPADQIWYFTESEKTAAHEPEVHQELNMIAIPAGTYSEKQTYHVFPMYMQACPLTYAEWKPVYDWAVAHGYSFKYDGAMGSTFWFNFPHTPDEPLCSVAWHDCLVWCNALSEMEGRTPAYYTDKEQTKVYRQAFSIRPLRISTDDIIETSRKKRGPWVGTISTPSYAEPWIFQRWDVNGYRLPTYVEWMYAAKGNCKSKNYWNDTPEQARDWAMLYFNSGMRTHPVGKRKPNEFGLYDIIGNVYERLNGDKKIAAFDLKNPKGNRYRRYGEHPAKSKPVAMGSSWWTGKGGFADKSTLSLAQDGPVYFGYADLGLRVVRCKAGTHIRDGQEPIELPRLDLQRRKQ